MSRLEKPDSEPGTPPMRALHSGSASSASSDEGNNAFRKASPLSSMRPRGGVASSADAYHRSAGIVQTPFFLHEPCPSPCTACLL